MEQPILEIRQAEICYGDVPVVKDVSLKVERGKILAVVGESGSGKSTLLRACMRLLKQPGKVTKGEILYKGTSVLTATEEEMRRLRGPEMGIVFQDCRNAFCPVRRIGVQMVESVREHDRRISRREVKKRAEDLMENIGLKDPERIWNSYPFELSGGMNQRVGIVTAMLMKPDLLFADEPTSALDVTVQREVIRELMLLNEQYGTTIVLVTHNLQAAACMAEETAVFYQGRIAEQGRTEQILHAPGHAYTKRLIRSVPCLQRHT